ncbi:glycosyltransferase [Xanthobacteraceae bacterium A53D]
MLGTHQRRNVRLTLNRSVTAEAPRNPKHVVTIPARDEEDRIVRCIDALRAQRALPHHRGDDLGIVLLVNNCRDSTFEVAERSLKKGPIPFRLFDVTLSPADAHAGSARGMAMDLAAAWLESVGQADGVILTTDADSHVPSDWLRRIISSVNQGSGAVAGRVVLDSSEARHLPTALLLRRMWERQYEDVLLELAARIDPIPHDPWPNHWTSSGANLAVTLKAYRTIGGLPHVACGEDKALVDALLRHDVTVRHDPNIPVTTSARLQGRAHGGFADTMRRRAAVRQSPGDEALEALPNAVRRYLWRRRLREWHAQGALARVQWQERLGVSLALEQSVSESFGAFWERIETTSPILLKSPLSCDLLATHTAAGRRLLSSLNCASLRPFQ